MLEEGNEASWGRDADADNSDSCPLARCGRLFAPSGLCGLHTNPMRQVIIVLTLKKGRKQNKVMHSYTCPQKQKKQKPKARLGYTVNSRPS